MQYHIAKKTHPSAEFGLSPLFPATLLTSPNFTNVTGGQRIELMLQDSKPTVLSGVRAPSQLVVQDVFFQGGLVHIVDAVFKIPISFPSTITAAGLNNLVALLNKGGWLNPSSPAVGIVNDLSDLTVLGPDNPQFGAGFTGFDALSEDELNDIFRYSIVQQSPPLYSSEFKNNTKHQTLQPDKSVLLTAANGGFYVDAARITKVDYLVSNGVLQVIDQPLNPATSGIGPVIEAPESSKPSTGLSTPAIAGLAIGIVALLLGAALVLALILRNRKRRGLPLFGNPRRFGAGQHRLPEEETPGISAPRMQPAQNTTRGFDFGQAGMELADAAPPRYGAHELDNKDFPSPPGTAARGTVSVVEIHNQPGQRGTMRTVDSEGRTVTIYGSDGRPLPPKPPSPQEIDGNERSRISISISGEAPRHLGFQARY